jgi:hypothetical protein
MQADDGQIIRDAILGTHIKQFHARLTGRAGKDAKGAKRAKKNDRRKTSNEEPPPSVHLPVSLPLWFRIN